MSAPVPAPVPLFRLPSGCDLLNIGCQVQTAAWEAWSLQSWPVKALVVIGAIAVIAGALRGFLALLHRVGGWPAVLGALAVIAGLVLAVLPRKPKDTSVGWEDGEPQKRTVPPRKGPARNPWDNWPAK